MGEAQHKEHRPLILHQEFLFLVLQMSLKNRFKGAEAIPVTMLPMTMFSHSNPMQGNKV